MIRFEAAYIRPCKASRSTFNSSKFIQYFNQQNPSNGIYDNESFTASTFDAKNVNAVKRNRMFGNIKHSNEYKTFEKKSIAKNHQIQNK